jgi:periplasmic divalent cation tolerance protein
MHLTLCTAPATHAESIARALVDECVAVCVNVVPGVLSIYRWKGEVTRDDEVLLVIKTRDDKIGTLREALIRLHPYEVPEIVTLAPSDVNAAYARWVDEETE